METVRKEILPGVWLTALRSDKFKTGCLSINLLTQLDRETASYRTFCAEAADTTRIWNQSPRRWMGFTAAI